MLLKAVFWDLDGTLIDSEPLWHDGEIEIAHNNGGEWNEDLGWECSGTPVPHVAEVMIAHGCTLSVPEIDKQLKDYVFKAEVERLPWIPGVQDVLHSLKEADIPSMLVTTSPRRMAENIMKQADGLKTLGERANTLCQADKSADSIARRIIKLEEEMIRELEPFL